MDCVSLCCVVHMQKSSTKKTQSIYKEEGDKTMQYGQRGGGGGSSDTCLSLKDFHLSLVFFEPHMGL